MGSYRDQDRTVALGGIFQGARLARDIARRGVCEATAFETSRESLFDFEPRGVAEVFGGPGGIALGLRTLVQQFDEPSGRDPETSRYVVAVVHLCDRLMRNRKRMQALGDELAALARRRAQLELDDGDLHQSLSTIYQEHISPLGPRIIVRGEPLHLRNPGNAARVRVALLAALRAAVLWRQAGGRKWSLLLHRRRFAQLARELLHEHD
jgi:high frequency lysogenization protein